MILEMRAYVHEALKFKLLASRVVSETRGIEIGRRRRYLRSYQPTCVNARAK